MRWSRSVFMYLAHTRLNDKIQHLDLRDLLELTDLERHLLYRCRTCELLMRSRMANG